MERPALLFIGLCALVSAFGQMVLPSGTELVIDDATSLRVDAPLTWTLEAGSIAVNNGTIVLGSEANLDEATGAAITGTGTERTTRDLTGPLTNENPGGLGGILTTGASLGNTLLVRGHTPFTDYSGHVSIARWLDFSPANNSGLNATLGFRYDPAELNGSSEAEQRIHIRAGQNLWWYYGSTVNTGTHTVTALGLDSLGTFSTFDQDLPNTISVNDRSVVFALLGAPGEKLYLRVPAGSRAGTLEMFASNGARITTLSPNWGEGQHALPELPSTPGVYWLRVNGQTSFSFLRP